MLERLWMAQSLAMIWAVTCREGAAALNSQTTAPSNATLTPTRTPKQGLHETHNLFNFRTELVGIAVIALFGVLAGALICARMKHRRAIHGPLGLVRELNEEESCDDPTQSDTQRRHTKHARARVCAHVRRCVRMRMDNLFRSCV